VFCFVSVPCLGVKIQIWRHHFLNTLRIKDVGWEDIRWICLTKDRNGYKDSYCEHGSEHI
jgi:hypothetical protein